MEPLECVQVGNKAMTIYTREEVARHMQPSDLWVIIDDEIYDLSLFLKEHPGGAQGMFATRS